MAESRVPTVTRFFPAHSELQARFDREARQMPAETSSPAAFEAWRTATREHLRAITGIDSMRHADPQPVVTESVPRDGYVRHRMEIHTEPDVVMPLYALLPDGLQPGERRPVVIAPHGHGSGGKNMTAGRRDIPAVADTIEL